MCDADANGKGIATLGPGMLKTETMRKSVKSIPNIKKFYSYRLYTLK